MYSQFEYFYKYIFDNKYIKLLKIKTELKKILKLF